MSRKLITAEFIVKSRLKHGDKFDYSQSIYCNNTTLIKIICKTHGVFTQRPAAHMSGKGCVKCANDNIGHLVHIAAAKRRDGIYLYSDSKVTEIALTKGHKAIVDTEILSLFEGYNWSYLSTGYAITTLNNRKSLLMHVLISNYFYDREPLDHKNRNKLDNRRCNLRPTTAQENCRNTRGALGKTSQYKGVFLNRQKGKWQSKIEVSGKVYHLGYFTDEQVAAESYNKKAIELFGEFAYLNTIKTK